MRSIAIGALSLVLFTPSFAVPAERIITTVAGGGPDHVPALSANLDSPSSVAVDSQGNLYIADFAQHRVFKIDGGGLLTVVAGTGTAPPGLGLPEDFCVGQIPVTGRSLFKPLAVAVDRWGNVFIADSCNHVVRRVDAVSGGMKIVAGTGVGGFGGDGGPATRAALQFPTGLAVDAAGNLFIADAGNFRVRRVDAGSGDIRTVAGTGYQTSNGDGGLAIHASLVPHGVALDAAGNLYVTDNRFAQVRRVDAEAGTISTVVGTGTPGFSGDGGPARLAQIAFPWAVAVDGAGHLFIADSGNLRVRRVDGATGVITTVAGNGSFGAGGDGGPATEASFGWVFGLAPDASGNLFVADAYGGFLRRVDGMTGVITRVAGNGSWTFSGDGGQATGASLLYPTKAVADAGGNLFIADYQNARIRRVDSTTRVITTVVGTGEAESSGDGGPAREASTYAARLALDAQGNLYIVDITADRIRRVDVVTGLISTVAGSGANGFSGDGGPAIDAALNLPTDVAVDRAGNLFVSDNLNDRIRRVDAATGIITTVAGTGRYGHSGDGGTAADLRGPRGVSFDRAGNLYFADAFSHRVRRVDAVTGIITTVAGNGTRGSSGDGGPGTNATLDYPRDVAVDATDSLFISEGDRIRRLDPATGIITTVAGGGPELFGGDGGPATAASMAGPSGVSIDPAGGLLVADALNHRIRRVAPANRPPEAAAGADFARECDSPEGTVVMLDGSASGDPDSIPGTHEDIVDFEWIENLGESGETLLGRGETLSVVLPLGHHRIALRVTDRAGESDVDEVSVRIEDTTPPRVSLRLEPGILWPPDHRLVPVRAWVDAHDACGPATVTLLRIVMDDPGGGGDGRAAPAGRGSPAGPDIQGATPGTADFDYLLRAERSGVGPGRTYTVTYLAADSSGNVTTATAEALVPRSQSPRTGQD
jgi:sugar lactone lactonase YvrE